MAKVVELVLGTAHLFGVVDAPSSRVLLDGARRAGLRRVDTAPSYGHGATEGAIGELVGRHRAEWTVTTKVGIVAVAAPSTAVRAVKFVARRLPGGLQDRLRGERPPGGGQFDVPTVAASIRRSLDRLGRIDRLMLHEVHPQDITPELVQLLTETTRSGDVAAVGLATGNEVAAQCLALAPDLFSVVHLAVGLRAAVPTLPQSLTVVGHGALGAGGSDFVRLAQRLERMDSWGARWRAATRDSRWEGRDGLADALLIRAATRPGGHAVAEVIVASSRLDRIVHQKQLLDENPALDRELRGLLDEAATTG